MTPLEEIRPRRGSADVVLRAARDGDLAAIVAIYNASIPGRLATADTVPVTIDARRAWFSERDRQRHPIWVAEHRDGVVGWLSFGAFYGRPAYAGTAEVGLYVAPERQRQGIATALLAEAVERAGSLGLTTLLGFVFAHNLASVALCTQFGFETWGHLPRVALLDGRARDLLILGRRIESPAPFPSDSPSG